MLLIRLAFDDDLHVPHRRGAVAVDQRASVDYQHRRTSLLCVSPAPLGKRDDSRKTQQKY